MAISCEELQTDIISIQGLLDNSRPQDCTDEVMRDHPDACLTMTEARNRYNDAMAKVTIIEGLIALGQRIEGTHNSLRHIDREEIDEAANNVEAFFRTFERARLVQLSMQVTTGTPRSERDPAEAEGVGDRSIWDDYEGDSFRDLRSHFMRKCVRETVDFREFCQEIRPFLAGRGSTEERREIFETLQGFANAIRNHVTTSDRNRNFARYREYLTVNIGSFRGSLDAPELNAEAGPLANVRELQRELQEYRSRPSARTEERIGHIVQLSRHIQEMNVSFGRSEGLPAGFREFASANLEKTLTRARSASGVFLNINETRDNFATAKRRIDINLESTQTNTQREATQFVSQHMASECNREGESPVDCIERVCNSTNLIEDRCGGLSPRLSGLGLSAIHSRIKQMRRGERLSGALGDLNQCMNQGIEQVRSCISGQLGSLNERFGWNIDPENPESSLEAARRDLADAQEILNHNANSSNIRELETLKAMALVQMQLNGCGANRKHTIDISSVCGSENLLNMPSNFVQFEQDLGASIVSYNKEIVDSLYQDRRKTSGYEHMRDQIIENCASDPNPAYANLCNHLALQRSNEDIQIPEQISPTVLRHLSGAGPRWQPDTSERTAAIWRGVGMASVGLVTQGLGAAIQAQQTESYLDSWRYQSQQNAYWNEYYRNNPYSPNGFMNWGYDYWSPYDAQYFQYNTSGQIYYQHAHHNFGQFTFPAPGSTTPGMFTVPPSIGPAPASSGSFQFNFST